MYVLVSALTEPPSPRATVTLTARPADPRPNAEGQAGEQGWRVAAHGCPVEGAADRSQLGC